MQTYLLHSTRKFARNFWCFYLFYVLNAQLIFSLLLDWLFRHNKCFAMLVTFNDRLSNIRRSDSAIDTTDVAIYKWRPRTQIDLFSDIFKRTDVLKLRWNLNRVKIQFSRNLPIEVSNFSGSTLIFSIFFRTYSIFMKFSWDFHLNKVFRFEQIYLFGW